MQELRNFETVTQFINFPNAQRNFEIAQISKMRGTYLHGIYMLQGVYVYIDFSPSCTGSACGGKGAFQCLTWYM